MSYKPDRTPTRITTTPDNSPKGCFVFTWLSVFVVGGFFVLVLRTSAANEPWHQDHDDKATMTRLANAVTAGWALVLIGLAVAFLLLRRKDVQAGRHPVDDTGL